MKTVPVRDSDALMFFRLHAGLWVERASQIGVDPAAARAFDEAQAAAQAAYAASQEARLKAQAATHALRLAMAEARAKCGLVIRAVRLYADSTGDESVYSTAQLDPVRDPVRGRPPTQPDRMNATLTNGRGEGGGIRISWRPSPDSPETPHLSASTAGVVFVVRRSIDDDTRWTTIGVVAAARAGKRGVTAFTDTTVPAGSRQVRYSVQPRRTTGTRSREGDGGLIGPSSNVLVVSLGSGQPEVALDDSKQAHPGRRAA